MYAQEKPALPEARPDARGLMPCWSCKGPVACGKPFCHICAAVQPPGQVDHFARLGLDVSFDMDQEALDLRYFGLQRHLHPDRFATKTPCERMLSQQQATSLNEAYETLRDPLSRAAYMVGLEGRAAFAEDQGADPALLIESMERREALAEAETAADVDAIAGPAAADARSCVGEISAAFKVGDLDAACRLTMRLKYLRKLDEEARARKVRLGRG
jgi:molecular chaperone HscB